MIEFFEDNELENKVHKEIQKFSKQKLKGNMIFARGEKIEIFLVDGDVYSQFKSIKRNPYSLGFFLGTLKGENFIPSLQILHNVSIPDKARVVVNPKGEKAFIYGKDIISKDVVWILEDVVQGDMVVVCNEDNEPLGFAEALTDSRIMKKLGREQVLKNINDIGWYIRRGR